MKRLNCILNGESPSSLWQRKILPHPDSVRELDLTCQSIQRNQLQDILSVPFCLQLMEAFLQHPQQVLALCQTAGSGLGKVESVKPACAERKWGLTDTNSLAYVGIRAWTENYSFSLPHFVPFLSNPKVMHVKIYH